MVRTEKAVLLTFFLAIIISCMGCQSDRTSADYSILGIPGEIVTVLFSDEEQIENESDYYDAILDFQRIHPDYIQSITVVSPNEEDLVEAYHIESFPTLIVLIDNDMTTRIEGNLTRAQIFNHLVSELNIDEQDQIS
ncbi:hypothetical protein [Alteribacter populi]|uniref:hypothetical protein n=1 Tax=Alteribacter populi TaxID=2011011 RepID=UPI000BBA42A3|nr:hypothetical protein [Alteribacter populi]